MALDKQVEQWLKDVAGLGLPPLQEMGLAEAREAYRTLVRQFGLPPIEVAEVTERSVPGPDGDLRVRIYRPEGTGLLPVLVYFHGGGFVLGDLEVVHGPCTLLANRAHAMVVSVDYRLAPEHRFPAAVEDCFAVTRWVAEHAPELGVDAERLALGGDSAGGTLAAVVAAMARDHGGPDVLYQLLLYPATDASCSSASYRDNGQDYFLTTELMQWFYAQYLDEGVSRDDWRVSPLCLPDTKGLPPAFVLTAEYDPLRDEGEAYAARLIAGGATVTARRYLGQIHAFAANLAGALGQGRRALEQAAIQLRQAFRAGWDTRM